MNEERKWNQVFLEQVHHETSEIIFFKSENEEMKSESFLRSFIMELEPTVLKNILKMKQYQASLKHQVQSVIPCLLLLVDTSQRIWISTSCWWGGRHKTQVASLVCLYNINILPQTLEILLSCWSSQSCFWSENILEYCENADNNSTQQLSIINKKKFPPADNRCHLYLRLLFLYLTFLFYFNKIDSVQSSSDLNRFMKILFSKSFNIQFSLKSTEWQINKWFPFLFLFYICIIHY